MGVQVGWWGYKWDGGGASGIVGVQVEWWGYKWEGGGTSGKVGVQVGWWGYEWGNERMRRVEEDYGGLDPTVTAHTIPVDVIPSSDVRGAFQVHLDVILIDLPVIGKHLGGHLLVLLAALQLDVEHGALYGHPAVGCQGLEGYLI